MKNSNTSNIFIFSYLKNSILYKPENPVIREREYEFLSLEKKACNLARKWNKL